jgi:hypothetical protein
VTSIRRGEDWWHRRPDGVWLLWSDASQSWEPQPGSLPPPPPPPTVVPPAAPGTEVAAAPTATAVAAEGSAVAVATVPVQEPIAPAPVKSPPVETPAPENPADAADTVPMPTTSNLPPASVPPSPRAANGELYSKGGAGFVSRFESRTVTVVGGGLAIVALFVLTYLGASFVFRPGDDAAAAGSQKRVSPRKAFFMQVDELCAQASQSAMGLPPPGSPSEMAGFTRNAISTQRKLISDMKGIVPPPKDAPLFREIIKESKIQLGQMHGLLDEAASGDAAGTRAAMETVAASEKRIDRMSGNIGLKECSKA